LTAHLKAEPKVAVLVLNYNGKHHLDECLRSLRIQNYGNYEVYVVDNGSVDGSVEYVRESFPWVKIIAFDENFGFSKAYNKAVRMLDFELIAFLNNDTKVKEDWLKELVLCLVEDESVATVGSKMLLYGSPKLLNHAGTKITLIGGGLSLGAFEQDSERYNAKQIAGAVCGGAMLVRKKYFLEIGGFDEDFFAYFEDVDLCWRAWLYGFKVMYCPASVVQHKLGGSFGKKNPSKTFLGVRNRLMTIFKNFGIINMLKGLLLSIVYDVFRVISEFAKNGNAMLIIAIFRGYITVFINLKVVLKKRKRIQAKRVRSDGNLWQLGVVATVKESIVEYLKLHEKGW
jgi:GT2 family glycosyltransferase